MGYAENMRIMSYVNCGLASAANFLEERANGVSPQYSTLNLFNNFANGTFRIENAYVAQKYFHNPYPNMVNMFAGYGDPVSNTIGTLGMISSYSPWMFFNSPLCSYMAGPMSMMPYMGMGYYGFTPFMPPPPGPMPFGGGMCFCC